MKQILFLFIVCIVLSCQKHEKIDKKIVPVMLPKQDKDENNTIGFACYYEGTKSKPVENISKILKNKNYATLKTKLYDINTAEKYLATIACEKLEIKKLIKLSDKDLLQIKINKTCEEKVSICTGCTNNEELTLKEMFTSKNFLLDNVEKWLIESIK